MKYFLYFFAAAAVCAQTTSTSYVTDINGRRVADGHIAVTNSPGVSEKTERSQSINGRVVPLEQTEVRILRDDAGARITETLTRKYDQTGRLTSTDRIYSEELKRPDGGSTTRATVARGEVNGRFVETERRTIEKSVAGGTTTVQGTIERKALNGGFEVAAKTTSAIEKTPSGESINESEFRRSETGQFYEATRRVTARTVAGGVTNETGAEYEIGALGRLELVRQTGTVTTKAADGREVSEITLYDRATWGRAQNPGARMQVQEQQVVERVPSANGDVTEILSVRRPSISDPNKLGELRKVSEIVCHGKCRPDEK